MFKLLGVIGWCVAELIKWWEDSRPAKDPREQKGTSK